jgi:uncharacterized membrane protein (UPF0127 family)
MIRGSFIFLIFILVFPVYALDRTRVCIKNVCLDAEIADTEFTRQQGVMFRKGLADNQAMLFAFEEEGRPEFWMKDTYFPLDFIWINKDKIVVDINTNVPPCLQADCPRIIPSIPAQYVLEVKAGTAQKNKIKIGDKVSF